MSEYGEYLDLCTEHGELAYERKGDWWISHLAQLEENIRINKLQRGESSQT